VAMTATSWSSAMCVGLADFRQDSSIPPLPAAGCRWSTFGSKTPAATASMAPPWASAEFDEDSQEKRPTVQVGDPFAEKLLIEATLELHGARRGGRHPGHGAAGLTSSSVEMAGKGSVGVELDLDLGAAA